jgi:diguanylate cyclase (GGDEF)-like protein
MRRRLAHPSLVSLLRRSKLVPRWPGQRPPPIAMTWWLLGISVALLLGQAFIAFMVGHGGPVDLAVSIATATLVGSAVLNARASGMQVARRQAETESFSRILRALARSVSPDAVVEAIVHELGKAASADHVAVVRMRPGETVLDVTFVSMGPGTPTSNTVMPLQQLAPVETRRVRPLRHQPAASSPLAASGNAFGGAVSNETAVWQEVRQQLGLSAPSLRNRGSKSRGSEPDEKQANAQNVADRIAFRLRDVYGLRNTLAAPLQVDEAIVGAIILSRRTDESWPDATARLLRSAASETSAALVRVYSIQAVESEARTDQLTQLPNRRHFDEYCTLLASRRRASDKVAILAVDVDHFKRINDQYGHPVGDQVLRAIGNAIQVSVRDEDVPARYGGEEFVVLLRNPAPGVALEIGERIRQSVRELDLSHSGVLDRVTVSVGVAAGNAAGEPISAIVERADRALYAAKRGGRDRVVPT